MLQQKTNIGLLILTILNLVSCIFQLDYIYLTENQILYIYTDMAQIAGGILALLGALYPLNVNRVDECYNGEMPITALNIYRYNILVSFKNVIYVCVATIGSSLLVLVGYNGAFPRFMISFLMNQSAVFFIILLWATVYYIFVCSSSPKHFIDSAQKEIEMNYYNYEYEDDSELYFHYVPLFSVEYKVFEEKLLKCAVMLLSEKIDERNLNYYQAVEILYSKKIIDDVTKCRLEEIREYNNILLSKGEYNVLETIHVYNFLKKLDEYLQQIITSDDEERDKRIQELQAFTTQYTFKLRKENVL